MSATISPSTLPSPPPLKLADQFSNNVAALLEKIDCRHADTTEERQAIFRLRYDAYLREGTILPDPSGSFSDRYDETDNVYQFGLYLNGDLASAIRIHVSSIDNPCFPSFDVFRDVLGPKLEAGKVIIDATRFVCDEKLSRRYRALPYATLRLNWLAAGYFHNGYSLAAIRPEHQAFYQRTFGLQLLCGARPYPHLAKPICLMASDYRTVADHVHRRFPFFRSTFFERRMLFEQGPALPAHQSPRTQEDGGPFDERTPPLLAG
jgi:hypothetical protein